jgi:hypothetical protein
MVFNVTTSLDASDVIRLAKRFFAERIPHHAAFPEKEGDSWLVLRGQGGEEIALATSRVDGVTRVRASTLLFDHAVDRFLGTLPPVEASA